MRINNNKITIKIILLIIAFPIVYEWMEFVQEKEMSYLILFSYNKIKMNRFATNFMYEN